MANILVIGAGNVGSFISTAIENGTDHNAWLLDADRDALHKDSCAGKRFLMPVSAADDVIRRADLVISCVPSSAGREVQRKVLEVGRPLVDVSFEEEEPWQYHNMAKRAGVPFIPDCGFCPGLSHFFAGRALAEGPLEELKIYSGGLPMERNLPWEYEAHWNVRDVLEEFKRPARYVQEEHILTVNPLDDVIPIYVEGIGSCEAFMTDGLRTLLSKRNDIPEMEERTIRYPGHCDKLRPLLELKFTQEVISHLTEQWTPAGGSDFCVLQVYATTKEDTKITYHLWFDNSEREAYSAMAQITGIPAVCMAECLLDESMPWEHGLLTMENIGQNHPKLADNFITGLQAFDVQWLRTEDTSATISRTSS